MARPKRIRKVKNPPHYRGFNPIGMDQPHSPVVMNFEEYESIRLSDYELLGQVEERLTGITPTFMDEPIWKVVMARKQ